MNKLFLTGVVLSAAVFLNGCSGTSKTNVEVSESANAANSAAAANAPIASGGDATANVTVSPANNPIAGDVAVPTTNGANTMTMPTPIPNGKEIAPGIVVPPGTKVEIKNNPNATLNAAPKPLQIAAPENSTVETQMEGDGKVTRVRRFKNHPKLVEIREQIAAPNQPPTIVVITRAGSQTQIADVKGLDIANAPSAEILKRIGDADAPNTSVKNEAKQSADNAAAETQKP